MTLHTVLLDIDGTVLLSTQAHAEAWARTFSAHGYDVSADQVRPLIGIGGDRLIAKLVPGLKSDEGEGKTITSERQELFLREYAPHLAPAPGARALVARMQQAGFQLVVASSAKQQELAALLKAAQVDDLLHAATTSDDAEQSKPAPDIVEAALRQVDADAESSIMLGDTPYDIESAGRAGVPVIALRCGGHSDEDLRGASAIYDDPQDVLDHFDSTPLAQAQMS